MELAEFLALTQADVRARVEERQDSLPYPWPEVVFTEVVMEHLADIGMTYRPQPCHYSAKVGGSHLKLSGYAFSEEGDQVDLFVSLYEGTDTVQQVADDETKKAGIKCMQFLTQAVEGRLKEHIDPSQTEALELANLLEAGYLSLERIRIFVVTDRQAKTKEFKKQVVSGKAIDLQVMDISRLFNHLSAGKPRDEIVVDFVDLCGSALPCVFIPGHGVDFDCALAALPAEALRWVYQKYGGFLLEANVRSFLGATGKINGGVRDTLRNDPGHFMAFNNGVVLVADEIMLGRTVDGSHGITGLKGMQIVNGGQTTASIYFTKRKYSDVDLSHVRVPAKIIRVRSPNDEARDALISNISRFANSQNAVKLSDLSANKPFHVELERLAQTTICPNGVGRWFYERAAGSYTTLLAREGGTPARLKHLRTVVCPPSRKLTKTDVAKYLHAWAQRPHDVAFGTQKNFDRFMESLKPKEGEAALPLPAVQDFKDLIAKAILFKEASKEVAAGTSVPRTNIATYVVSLVANRLGDRFDLNRIWLNQDISNQLRALLAVWAREVEAAIRESNQKALVSEWAKRPECWEAVRTATYSEVPSGIPEVRPA
jgi:hypothetical protein